MKQFAVMRVGRVGLKLLIDKLIAKAYFEDNMGHVINGYEYSALNLICNRLHNQSLKLQT